MTLKPGVMKTLTVARISSFGYFLTDGTEDVLLHRKEATKELEVDDKVDVFLYHDHQQRLAATMEKPLLTDDGIAWLEVVNVKQGHGLFLYNGISRDLFLSIDELPEDRKRWPRPGDRLPVSMTYDKKGRVMAKLVKGAPIETQAKQADKTLVNSELMGHVYHMLDNGAFLFTDEGYLAFLHNKEMTEQLRLGQALTVRVIFVREDGRVNVTLKPHQLESRISDSVEIYNYLQQRGGAMPYWDKSPSEDIKKRFGISKAAFKRALGKLMKENKVYQEEGWTYAKEKHS
ncbi:CvfB family protein [Desertibacillus haloalkaliphilus]|uniref:CvfB family protein n=1 Tax=Desertibacillus haloalkaliphilus TaxID=1328930 RepID=UPI001C26B9F4|nr:S1-like domain-containing RNA-binding protein [Desertibacillus haloalkaliphilus]MBU8905614.1 hypothetical protein [Desertibacillus haloalkaliphilus]